MLTLLQALQSILLSYNTSWHSSIKQTPYFVFFGREYRGFDQHPTQDYLMDIIDYDKNFKEASENRKSIDLNVSQALNDTADMMINYSQTNVLRFKIVKTGDIVWVRKNDPSVQNRKREKHPFHPQLAVIISEQKSKYVAQFEDGTKSELLHYTMFRIIKRSGEDGMKVFQEMISRNMEKQKETEALKVRKISLI